MVAGGISFYGLSDLMLVQGTMNDFTYPQALSFYKESYDSFKKLNENLYFEQDGASCHTSKSSKTKLDMLFPKKILQNPPNSPDLAYPIETICAELKKKVKARDPKNAEELKTFMIEEWNKIPQRHIQKRFKNYVERCQKIIELGGDRIKPINLREIRKKNKENEEENDGNRRK